MSFHVRVFVAVIGLLLIVPAVVLSQPSSPSIPPETSQFDFWVGDWDASWQEGQHAVNHISKRWDRVLVEEFNGAPASPLEGHSVSVYMPGEKLWKQTWVDNQGAYLDFTGGFADGKMTLSRSFQKDGKTIRQRMVWYDITPDAFKWNWERSLDDGKTWEAQWKINYTRKKDPR